MKQNTGEQLRDMQKAFANPLNKRIKELEMEVAGMRQQRNDVLHALRHLRDCERCHLGRGCTPGQLSKKILIDYGMRP